MEISANQPFRRIKIEDSSFINVKPPTLLIQTPVTNNKRKPKYFPTCLENLSYYFSQFCNSTSIHGIKYVGERGRFMVEKVIWTVILTIIFYFCISLICKAYNKWVTSPVIVTFATTETAISKIPFPAITICPEVKSDPEIFNYTDVLLKKIQNIELNENETRYFETFSLVCRGVGEQIARELFSVRNLTVDDDVIYDFLMGLPDIDPVNATSLNWLQTEYKLEEMLSGTFTSEGFCYSFNMLEYDEILFSPEEYVTNRSIKDTKARQWSLEGGYPDNDMSAFPRRTFISGINGGFMFDMFTNHSHLDYLCGESLQGFKVTLHHPSELPDMDKHFRVPLDQAVYVGIKPRMIIVSEALRSYTPEVRKCYFDHEKPLKYYKSYTQNNCLRECLSNHTKQMCGCAGFYMPKDDATPICGPGSLDCIDKSKITYLSHQIDNKTDLSPTTNRTACECLPSCTSLEYDVEISQTDWNWRKAFQVFTRLGIKVEAYLDYEKTNLSRLAVFYKEMQFMSSERNELYGYVDFFSNTGGLLGLFIGLSVTSLIEIVYFLTLRLVCNVKKFGRDFWSGESELVHGDKDNDNSSKRGL